MYTVRRFRHTISLDMKYPRVAVISYGYQGSGPEEDQPFLPASSLDKPSIVSPLFHKFD